MRSTFKVLFYVKKGSEKPNGNLPLMCRITVDGEIKQFSCKMDVPPRLWDVKNSRASGKSVEAQRINLAVDKIRVDVNRRYQELMQTDGYVTAAKLKDAYLGIGVKQETLLKLFEQHNAEFEKKVGHSRAQGTFTRYRTVCNHIREFLPHAYKREDIPLKKPINAINPSTAAPGPSLTSVMLINWLGSIKTRANISKYITHAISCPTFILAIFIMVYRICG